MAFSCEACNKNFNKLVSLQQHLNSPAHAPVFECDDCDRLFGSDQALQQHLNSPAHAPVFECDDCDRPFGSDQALQQHLNSPAHAPVVECDDCDRSFRSDQALQQHLNSPAHAPVFEFSRNPSSVKPFDLLHRKTRSRSSQWRFNPESGRMMDMTQDEDWSLCDKDCSWCGHCAESYWRGASIG